MVKAINLIQGSYTEQIFKFFLKRKAATTREIIQELGLKKTNISSYLKELLKKGLIKKSTRRVQSKVRKCSTLYVYGLSDMDIQQKIHQIEGSIDHSKFITGIRKHIMGFLENTDKGYTTAEIMMHLRTLKGYEQYSNWDYLGTLIRDMVLQGQCKRSYYKLPANAMIHGRKPGYAYGINEKAVNDKILSMMPKEVNKAYMDIIHSNGIFPIDVLKRRFGLHDQLIKSWFTFRLVSLGAVKTYSYKQRRYYYSPQVSEDYVKSKVPKIHEEEVINAILENSKLGTAFEKQAIFYFVWYLILKRGRQIRLNKNFPKKIPSWWSREDNNNPEFVKIDEKTGKNKDNKPIVDVWKFDREPADYVIGTYDDNLESPSETYMISIKRDYNGKLLGVAGKRYIASMYGCLSAGISLDGYPLPKRQMVPVLIANSISSNRVFPFAKKLGCDIFYRSRFKKIVDFCNEHGIYYSDDKVLEQMMTEFNLMEKYKNHEAVLLGKVTPSDLLRMRERNATQS